MTTQETQAFIDDVLGYAREAATELRIPVSPILAQWIDETGSGSSTLFRECNNFAGVFGNADAQVEKLGAHIEPHGFLCYPDHATGVKGYVMRWRDPVYATTRDAWVAADNPVDVARAMQFSPWASGHYNYRDLVDLIEQLDLTKYDSGNIPTPAPGPGPETPCSALPAGPAPEGHRTLKVGDHGADVETLQADLASYGFIPVNSHRADGSWDGIFGPGTATAVVGFQEHHGLRADGIVGRQTWCALGVR